MQWLVLLRAWKWTLGVAWGVSLLLIGGAVAIHAPRGSPVIGLGIIAMGEYVLMFIVLDDCIQPVDTEITGFMKLTAAMVFWMSLGYGLWQWQAML